MTTHDAETRAHIADTEPVTHAMPAAPFGRVRALWLCRVCSYWNRQDRTACIDCKTERPE